MDLDWVFKIQDWICIVKYDSPLISTRDIGIERNTEKVHQLYLGLSGIFVTQCNVFNSTSAQIRFFLFSGSNLFAKSYDLIRSGKPKFIPSFQFMPVDKVRRLWQDFTNTSLPCMYCEGSLAAAQHRAGGVLVPAEKRQRPTHGRLYVAQGCKRCQNITLGLCKHHEVVLVELEIFTKARRHDDWLLDLFLCCGRHAMVLQSNKQCINQKSRRVLPLLLREQVILFIQSFFLKSVDVKRKEL